MFYGRARVSNIYIILVGRCVLVRINSSGHPLCLLFSLFQTVRLPVTVSNLPLGNGRYPTQSPTTQSTRSSNNPMAPFRPHPHRVDPDGSWFLSFSNVL